MPMLRECLSTPRLMLRRPTADDLNTIFDVHLDARAVAHNPSDALRDLDEARGLFERWDAHWVSYGYGYFSVDLRATGKTIGFCGFKRMSFRDAPVLNLFYRLAPAFWGQGFATEAALAVVQYADEALPDLPLIARVRPDNVASVAILSKIGLVLDENLSELGEDGVDLIYKRHRPY